MSDLNSVILLGNLTRDPELRYIPSGDAVATFGIAVSNFYTTEEGETKESTCFVNIETWRKLAENCSKYISKGRQVVVEGRLKLDSWETPEGEKRSKLKVVANRVGFLGRPKESYYEEPFGGAEPIDISEL